MTLLGQDQIDLQQSLPAPAIPSVCGVSDLERGERANVTNVG